MNKYDRMMLKLFVEERDAAILTFDVDRFKAFYNKWVLRGFYEEKMLPPDNIIEISMRKCVLAMANPPEDKLEEAKEWLLSHGYDLEIKA